MTHTHTHTCFGHDLSSQAYQLRCSNDDVEREIRKLDKQIVAKEHTLRKVQKSHTQQQELTSSSETRLRGGEQAIVSMQKEFEQKDACVAQKEHFSTLLEELNALLTQTDTTLEQLERAVETANTRDSIDREQGAQTDTQFESSPQMQLWLAVSGSAAATLKARNLGIKMDTSWISEDQVRRAQVSGYNDTTSPQHAAAHARCTCRALSS